MKQTGKNMKSKSETEMQLLWCKSGREVGKIEKEQEDLGVEWAKKLTTNMNNLHNNSKTMINTTFRNFIMRSRN